MTWSPEQYHRFAQERARPFWDLVDLIETDRAIRRAVDLGCGSGELTAAAARRLGVRSMLGLDTSPEMLASAAEHIDGRTTFIHDDLATWSVETKVDLALASASLQWVPDHVDVLTRWTASLAPGGQLAVQVPDNGGHPSHQIAADLGEDEPFCSAMGGEVPADPTVVNVLAPQAYAELLHALGYQRQHVRLQVYGPVLDSTADVAEWMRGTSLTRYFARLPEELHEPMVDEYRRRIVAALGDRRPYYFAFRRILFWARRPERW
ncbi:MAG: methyltransferase domain-containing protein [Actinomycetota bacterium]|nr:methyltransferase domain-containing protein [Actinomycetota bacterium]